MKKEEPPIRLLDDLFRKTKTTPCIYWLPLTPEQVIEFKFKVVVTTTDHDKQFLHFPDRDQRTGAIETDGRA